MLLTRSLSYNKAREIKEKQDAYCARVLDNDWHDLGEFPEAFQWEALVDVLRGKTKVKSNYIADFPCPYFRRLMCIVMKLWILTALFA